MLPSYSVHENCKLLLMNKPSSNSTCWRKGEAFPVRRGRISISLSSFFLFFSIVAVITALHFRLDHQQTNCYSKWRQQQNRA